MARKRRTRVGRGVACPNAKCPKHGQIDAGNITGNGHDRTRTGRRRRYDCEACHSTFCLNTGTPYFGLHASRAAFDMVANLAVEGVGTAAIGRVTGRAWNTVARWMEKAQTAAKRFNERNVRGYELLELQADEIRAAAPKGQGSQTWAFAAIEVSSRLWPATVVGRRTSENTERLLGEAARNAVFELPPLITTDGFGYYASAVRKVFSTHCVYGQVIKTRRPGKKSRPRKWGVRVERRLVTGTEETLRKALEASEDSEKLNTAFIERLNLTIRAAPAHLTRRVLTYARLPEKLAAALDLVRCHYNFRRPHRALRFGRETRTPAMQAGLAKKRLSFRDIFMAAAHP